MCAEGAGSDRVLTYPRKERGLGLFCFALFAALFLLLYAPGLADLRWELLGLVCLLARTAACFAGVILWDWPLGWLLKPRIILHPDGLTVGRRRVAWNDISEVKQGPWAVRRFVVRLLRRRPIAGPDRPPLAHEGDIHVPAQVHGP